MHLFLYFFYFFIFLESEGAIYNIDKDQEEPEGVL